MHTKDLLGVNLDYAVHLALNKQHGEGRAVQILKDGLCPVQLRRETTAGSGDFEPFRPTRDHLLAFMLIWHNLIGVHPVTRDGSVWQASLSHAKVMPRSSRSV